MAQIIDLDLAYAEAFERFEAMPPADPLGMFDHAYAELPQGVAAERLCVCQESGADRRHFERHRVPTGRSMASELFDDRRNEGGGLDVCIDLPSAQ